jgi:hypothetical protein
MSRIGGVFALAGLSVAALARADSGPEARLKSFRELSSYLSQVTRVSAMEPEIRKLYLSVMGRLPKTGDSGELKTTTVLAQVSLSGLYCRKMIERDAALTGALEPRRYLHHGIDFGMPAAALPEDRRAQVVGDYASVFWLRDAQPSETVVARGLMDDALAANGMTTVDALVSTCTLMASSLGLIAD